MPKAAFHNLGCKVNAYELESVIEQFQRGGFTIVDFQEKADVYVINTCTVTNMADRKSRQMLHRARKKNPNALVAALGCFVQTAGEEEVKKTGVDLAVGTDQKASLYPIVKRMIEERDHLFSEEKVSETTDPIIEISDLTHPIAYEEQSLSHVSMHSRAFVKVEDGCNQFCSYCVIPIARGRVRSRRPEDVIQEITGLVKNGVREVVLTGIHLSSYGSDFVPAGEKKPEGVVFYGKPGLLELIQMVCDIPGLQRVRLGSLEPRIVTPEFCEELSKLNKICPHFHLSLQSGCDKTLKAMNRHYTAEMFREACAELRKVFEDPAITTDVIVGFPGETDEDFEMSYDFCQETGFYEMHVFKYSRRKGTVADRRADQIPEEKKTERSAKLIELAADMTEAYRKRHLNSIQEILTEETVTRDGEKWTIGFTKEYIRAGIRGGYDANETVRGILHAETDLTDHSCSEDTDLVLWEQ